MSYEPEILVSKERDVLEEFRNPFTNAVCWDASEDDEFMSLVDNVLSLSALFEIGPFEPFSRAKLARLKGEVDEILMPNVAYMKTLMPHLSSIVMDSRPGVEATNDLLRYFQFPSETLSFASEPHTDLGDIGVFGSFNRKALATGCIPREFAGAANSLDVYDSARMDRSIMFPSASLYIVDIGVQPHFSPTSVPDDEFRVLETANFSY